MSDPGGGGVDYAALFAAMPSAVVVLDRHLHVVAANAAYLAVTRRRPEQLLGRSFFDAYPPDPDDPTSHGDEMQRRSLESVLASGEPSLLLLHRFAIPRPDTAGSFDPRWWNVVNQPVRDADGQVAFIIHRIEDISAFE